MKVLWLGDAACSSGFARCTHAVCNELHRQGHEVHVLGLNYFGDPHPYPYPIYPCRNPFDGGKDGYGLTRLPTLDARIKPGVIVLLTDPWNVKEYLSHLQSINSTTPVVGWLAVDSKNQKGVDLNPLSHVMVWTNFGHKELRSGGYSGSISIVPLGVDKSVFRPLDKVHSRSVACPSNIHPDSFIVGVVGRNQHRKRLDLTIKYYSRWLSLLQSQGEDLTKHYLYLHVAPTGDMGCDIGSLIRYYNLQGRVIINHPPINGQSQDLVHVYNSFNVYLSTSQAEGWCLPALEAMACGIPCVVPESSGTGSWVQSAALQIECRDTTLVAPMNGLAYTIGEIPQERSTVQALDLIYKDESLRRDLVSEGLTLSDQLTWDNTARLFINHLETALATSGTSSDNGSDKVLHYAI